MATTSEKHKTKQNKKNVKENAEENVDGKEYYLFPVQRDWDGKRAATATPQTETRTPKWRKEADESITSSEIRKKS